MTLLLATYPSICLLQHVVNFWHNLPILPTLSGLSTVYFEKNQAELY